MYILDKLNNGIKVVMEKIDHVRSITLGVVIKCGSINETEEINGISHFIEHMLFKGTKDMTAKQIAESIDNLGGHLNAFTGKENTCYYVNVLDEHIPIAIKVLGDMLSNSLFDEEDIEKEKKIIFEEINMYKDTPEDLVFELLNDIMFESEDLGLPILGNENSISSLSKDVLIEFYNKYYTANNMIISVAGKFNEKEIMSMLNEYFDDFDLVNDNSQQQKEYKFANKIKGINKNIEQLNICLGLEGISLKSKDLYAASLINSLFGGSMSSRLFQNIREEFGFVYAIDSSLISYNSCGTFNIYAGLNVKHFDRVAELINKEIEKIWNNSITKYELNKSKEQLKGNYILGTESTSSRMFENAKSMILQDMIETPKDILRKIDNIKMDDIYRTNSILFNKENLNIAYVGPIENNLDFNKQMFNIFDLGWSMKIKVVNKSKLELPKYKTKGSAGMDLMANLNEPIVLKPLDRVLVPTGLFVSIPKGYECQIRGRSGLALKNGITLANGIGTIDSDYRGEIKVILINLSNEEFIINHGDRIAQMILAKHEIIEFSIANSLDETSRGSDGFGSTGI